jgi:hypothetical protein
LEVLEPRWHGLVSEALAWEEGKPFDHLEEARGLIRFTQERASRD